MAQNIVKCAFCGLGVEKINAERYKNKNFHKNCCKKQKEKDELCEYICRLFSLKAPGPRIYTQLKNFFNKYPYYTYIGIKEALVYFYEVQKKPVTKSNQGIGIVPYIYDEAQEYFNNIKKKQEKIASEVGAIFSISPKKVLVKKKNETQKLYDLENL